MNLKKSRLLSLATSLLVMASSVVGISAASAETTSTPWAENFDAMTTYTGIDFDGNNTSVVADQPAGAGFTSGNAIKLLSKDVAWAGTKFILPNNQSVISADNATATVSVYSPDNLDRCFMMKLENSTTGINTGDTIQHVVQGWQTLTFNFSAHYNSAKTFNTVVLMPDFFGVGCNMVWNANNKPLTTWYVDNISLPGSITTTVPAGPVADTPSLFNFEGADTNGYFDAFGGETASKVTDAPAGGSVGSTTALKITDNGWAPWAGVTYGWHDTTLISATNSTATANIYAPAAGLPIMLKVEDGGSGGAVFSESATVTSVAGWHKYTFTFTGFNSAVTYGKTAVFVNFGAAVRSGDVWYVDDVAFAGATSALLVGADTPSLFNFEGDGTTGYVDSFGGETASIATDAPAGGSVGSTKALKITDNGWAGWAGVTFGWHDTTLISTANHVVTANIYAPVAGQTINLKVENGADGNINSEAQVTSVQGWHKYSFTFAGFDPAVVYGKAAIFVNFNGTKIGDVWYVDDVAFAGATSAALATVEVPETLTPWLFNFEGAGSTGYVDGFGGGNGVIAAETPAGGSLGSTKQLRIQDTAWETWGGITFGWVDNSLLSRTKHVATANIYAPVAGQTIKLKIEDGGNADINTEVDLVSVQGWKKYSFDFTNYDPALKYNKTSIFVNFGATGDARSQGTWFVDDVSFNGATAAGLGGPASGPATPYNVRLADWTAANSFDGTHVWGDGGLGSWFPANTGYFAHYVAAGSTFTLRYSVRNATTGAPAANGTVVKLRLGTGYSGSNGKFTVGGVTVNGVAPHNPTADIASKSLVVSGGYVTVQVTSNDVEADATDNPFSATANPDGLSQAFMQIKPEVDGNSSTNGDWVNILATKKPAAPTITSISGTSGKNGQAIDIVGTNLGDALGASVSLYTAATSKTAAVTTAVSVIAVSADGTRMTVRSPNKTQKGNFKVTTTAATATSASVFSAGTATTSKAAITFAASVTKEIGSTLTLTGANLGSATAVKIGTVSAPFTVVNANSITVTIPEGAVSGSAISVTNAGGTVATTKLVFQAPVITTATASGKVGSTVTVTGRNLKATAIMFGGNKSAKAVINDGNTLTFLVPSGATSGAIKITTGGGFVNTASYTVVPPSPTITSFSPATGKKGVAVVTLKGTNLLGATVSIGGVAVTLASGASATTFKFVIPAGAATGKISVTTAGGTVLSATNLTITN
jgi:hypothetical protein